MGGENTRRDDEPAAKTSPGPRRLWLCADDYGLSPKVSAAIRDLVTAGRLNATSAMVVSPHFNRSEALSLAMLNVGARRVEIGLHVVLTTPFKPLTHDYAPQSGEMFLPLMATLSHALLRRLDTYRIASEVRAQIAAFRSAFGALPDFIDGHQHVHLFPQVRDAVLGAAKDLTPNAWIRQCERAGPWSRRLSDRKGLLLDLFSRRFRRLAAEHGLRTNPAFAGTYDFASPSPIAFAERFASFLDDLPDGGLIMCHPGEVDAELERLDPLTAARAEEFAFFAGPDFPKLLAECSFTLATPVEPGAPAPTAVGHSQTVSGPPYDSAPIAPMGVNR